MNPNKLKMGIFSPTPVGRKMGAPCLAWPTESRSNAAVFVVPLEQYYYYSVVAVFVDGVGVGEDPNFHRQAP